MKSRDGAYRQQRNSLSILLSQLRRNLSAAQFQFFLRLQWAADNALRRKAFDRDFSVAWLEAVESSVQAIFDELEKGHFPREQISRLVHYYEHLFR